MLYNQWLSSLSKRYVAMLDRIAAEYNFDLGTEFEIVLAHFLERVLPAKCGVCRGFVVPARGTPVGDDLIIYDRTRFPTLRGLGADLSRKEAVPAEAVLAYIEAKHTLSKATLLKALKQLAAVKRTPRVEVTRRELVPGVLVGDSLTLAPPAPGWPAIQNPWYTAIVARRLDPDLASIAAVQQLLREGVTADLNEVPDVISADRVLVLPCFRRTDGQELRPFMAEGVASAVCDVGEKSFPLAVCHLLWAISKIVPAEVQWQEIFVEETRDVHPEMILWFTKSDPKAKVSG